MESVYQVQLVLRLDIRVPVKVRIPYRLCHQHPPHRLQVGHSLLVLLGLPSLGILSIILHLTVRLYHLILRRPQLPCHLMLNRVLGRYQAVGILAWVMVLTLVVMAIPIPHYVSQVLIIGLVETPLIRMPCYTRWFPLLLCLLSSMP